LWHAVDHATDTVIAYAFGKRKGIVFKQLKTLLDPFGIARFTPMTGALMNAIWTLISMRLASVTPRKSNEKTST